VLNDAGRMVQTVWDEIFENYSGVEIDEFVIMPSHINGIVVLVGATPCGRPDTGKVGQSTAFDLSFLAIAFAKQNGRRWRITIWYCGNVHAYSY